MAKSPTSSVVILVVLAAFTACPGGSNHPQEEPCRDEGTTSVLVGPAVSQVNPPCVKLHPNDQIYFMATDSNRVLTIDFPTKQPFQNMKQLANGRWAIYCKGSTCSSGPISTGAAATAYDYNQSLAVADSGTPPDKADGRIIIVRP
jgi:hypothetical protein